MENKYNRDWMKVEDAPDSFFEDLEKSLENYDETAFKYYSERNKKVDKPVD